MKQNMKEMCYIIGTAVAVCVALRYLLPLVVPFWFSFFFAKLLYPLVTAKRSRRNRSMESESFTKHKRKQMLRRCREGILTFLCMAGGVTVLFGGLLLLSRQLILQFGKFLIQLPKYRLLCEQRLSFLCQKADQLFSLKVGTCETFADNFINSGIEKVEHMVTSGIPLGSFQGMKHLFSAFWVIFLVMLGTWLIIKDMDELKIIWQESVFYQHGSMIWNELGELGIAYGKAQLFIFVLNFIIIGLGFFVTGNSYAVLLAFAISLIDAVPMVGCGLILVPSAILYFLKGKWLAGLFLLVIMGVCQLVRELLESKIIGSRLGIKPIFTILSMYAGLQIFGVFGFILGPVALVIIKTILKSLW